MLLLLEPQIFNIITYTDCFVIPEELGLLSKDQAVWIWGFYVNVKGKQWLTISELKIEKD